MSLVIAHRGASRVAPENTVEAFRTAVELGADWIELDVRRTADDVLIVSHDAHLADGRVIVDLAADELPAQVPTLAAALEACDGAGVNIEIKNDPDDPDYDAERQISDAVVGLALAFRDPGDLLISSFDLETVRRIRAVDPSLPAALVTAETMSTAMVIERAAAAGMAAIHPWEVTVDRRLVETAHAAGLAVNTWTVNDPGRIAELVALGVDGIITDDVAAARTVIGR